MRCVAFLILFTFCCAYLPGQTHDSLSVTVHDIVSEGIQQGAFPGCVVYAATSDKVLIHQAYGFHTYDSLQPVQLSTIYDQASVTKTAAAGLALMKMYEDGLYKLDEEIGNYIRRLGKARKSTFREIMAHQAGWKPWIPYYKRLKRNNGKYRRKTLSAVRDEDHPFPVTDSLWLHKDFYSKRIKRMIRKASVSDEKTYRYSGLFFYLVPELVNHLTGMEFKAYLRRKFYKPLGLERTGFNPLDEFDKEEIAPTEIDTFFRKTTIHGKVHDEGAILMEGISGNAGLFSTAGEIGKIYRMLLHPEAFDSLLKPHTVDLFTTVQYPANNNRRGLVFDKPLLRYDSLKGSVSRHASHLSFGHTGYTGTMVWADPMSDLVFVFQSNRVYPTRERRGLYELNIRPRIHHALYEYLMAIK